MDPNNPVVRLCGEGMTAEAEGREEEARELFRRAWDAASDDREACVAAHYLARHQPGPEETLHWNRECLRLAERVGDDRVRGFHASLHGSIGRALLELGRPGEAGPHFTAAADGLPDLPPGPYADWLRLCVARGLRETDPGPANTPAEERLNALVAAWCARADLDALALVLPALRGDPRIPGDGERLTIVLRMLLAERRLPAGERETLTAVISARTAPGRADAPAG
ncbi:hypothetical protein [Streptomyces alkaliphilus]|uniref:hypothetical protein n=1 Tax=Streptomyces alkaliphilus TaxID=1472722 RepID=UPI00117E7C1E|nr:hypothetical protein [Streptomyces alkaliphilus]MQS06314.1 hypothetical protein [Streptomyces alkaliphilus]